MALVGDKKHAGVEDFGLNLVVFKDKRQLKKMVQAIGLTIDKESETIISPLGEEIECQSCSKEITLSDVGHILPGSHYIYCRDPVCILDYMERFS